MSSVCVSILYACRGCYNALAACVGMFGSCWHYLRGYSLGGAVWWCVRCAEVFVVSVAGESSGFAGSVTGSHATYHYLILELYTNID